MNFEDIKFYGMEMNISAHEQIDAHALKIFSRFNSIYNNKQIFNIQIANRPKRQQFFK